MSNLLAEAAKINGMSEDEFLKEVTKIYATLASSRLTNETVMSETVKFSDHKIVITTVREELHEVVK